MSSEKSSRKEKSCGTCAFFGKPVFCLRRETFAEAVPCNLHEKDFSLREEEAPQMFPLLPDVGTRDLKEEEILEGPSLAWYLVPFFFGILGGIVAYIAVKDRDEDMAWGLLLFGIIWTVVEIILYFAVVSYYLNMLSRLY